MFEKPKNSSETVTAVEQKGYQQLFDIRGELYHRAMVEFPNARHHEFEIALELLELRNGHRLVDVPAGGGYTANYLKQQIDYVAVENSRVFADICKALRPGAEVIEGCMWDLPLSNGNADRLLSLAALHHVIDKPRVYREFYRLLATSGKAVIADVFTTMKREGFMLVMKSIERLI